MCAVRAPANEDDDSRPPPDATALKHATTRTRYHDVVVAEDKRPALGARLDAALGLPLAPDMVVLVGTPRQDMRVPMPIEGRTSGPGQIAPCLSSEDPCCALALLGA